MPNEAAPVRNLTPREAAEPLRVDRNTIYALIRLGSLPGVRRVGRQFRIDREQLARWVEGDT